MGDIDLRDRIIAAALRCVARWGISKSTLDDVAREAGCSRATIYRIFHGGKRELFLAVLQRERARSFATIEAAVGDAETLEDMLVAGTVAGSRFLAGHEALQYVLTHEPDLVLPHVAFNRINVLFAGAARFAEPHLARFVPAEEVVRATEWVTRVILSYALNPSERLDLRTEADARRLVHTYLLPSIQPLELRHG